MYIPAYVPPNPNSPAYVPGYVPPNLNAPPNPNSPAFTMGTVGNFAAQGQQELTSAVSNVGSAISNVAGQTQQQLSNIGTGIQAGLQDATMTIIPNKSSTDQDGGKGDSDFKNIIKLN